MIARTVSVTVSVLAVTLAVAAWPLAKRTDSSFGTAIPEPVVPRHVPERPAPEVHKSHKPDMMVEASAVVINPYPSHPTSEAPPRAEDTPSVDRIRDLAAAKIRDERYDRRWSDEVAEQLARVIADDFIGLKVNEIDCRTTLCRLHLEYTSREERQRFFEKNTSYPPFDNDNLIELEDLDGVSRAIIHVARQGQSLAAL